MGSLAEVPGLAFAAPAVIALLLLLVARWTLPDEVAQRYAAAVAFAAAYLGGWLLTASDPVPSRHWHWLPFLGAGAAVLGPVIISRGIGIGERTVTLFLASLGAAWMVVPTWASSSLPRLAWIPLLAAGFTLVASLLIPLGKKIPAVRLIGFLTFTALTLAGLTAGLLSLTYATQVAMAAAALAGAALAVRFSSRSAAGAIGLVFAWVIGGWAFVNCIDPQKPIYGLLVVPFAPLALWCCTAGPASKLKGWPQLAAQTAAVGTVLAIAAGLAFGLQ